MYKIGIIQRIHDKGLELLDANKNFEYEIIDDVSEDNLSKIIHLYDGVSLRVSKLSNNLLSKAKKLKVISRHGVGYDNVDTSYLKQNDITLLITATANAIAVSEHVFYLMLTISKNFLNLDNLIFFMIPLFKYRLFLCLKFGNLPIFVSSLESFTSLKR